MYWNGGGNTYTAQTGTNRSRSQHAGPQKKRSLFQSVPFIEQILVISLNYRGRDPKSFSVADWMDPFNFPGWARF